MDTGKVLQSKREEKGMTVEALAEVLGSDAADVRAWENGECEPGVEMLIKLAQVYEMSMDELLFGNTEAPEYNEDKAVYYAQTQTSDGNTTQSNSSDKEHVMAMTGKLSMIIIPAVCMIIYVILGAGFNLWSPGWVVLLVIPIYFILMIVVRLLEKNVGDAVEDYVSEEEKALKKQRRHRKNK